MARPLRLEYEGAVYHVTSRGNDKKAVYVSEDDRQVFLRIFEETVKKHRWLYHVYCLMDNHYHLLLETPEGNLSRGMMLLTAYTRRNSTGCMGALGMFTKGDTKPFLWKRRATF